MKGTEARNTKGAAAPTIAGTYPMDEIARQATDKAMAAAKMPPRLSNGTPEE